MMRPSVLSQWISDRHVPGGRNGAPKGAAGGGTRLKDLVAYSVPRDRADEAPKTSPKGDPKAPIELIG
jgi:hypothetical protein